VFACSWRCASLFNRSPCDAHPPCGSLRFQGPTYRSANQRVSSASHLHLSPKLQPATAIFRPFAPALACCD
jgi:hypothetical protein